MKIFKWWDLAIRLDTFCRFEFESFTIVLGHTYKNDLRELNVWKNKFTLKKASHMDMVWWSDSSLTSFTWLDKWKILSSSYIRNNLMSYASLVPLFGDLVLTIPSKLAVNSKIQEKKKSLHVKHVTPLPNLANGIDMSLNLWKY